ncbi:hypothetical protein GCM10027344_18780 [Spelaeicoccus albus]
MCSSGLIDKYQSMVSPSGGAASLNPPDAPIGSTIPQFPDLIAAPGTRGLIHLLGAFVPGGSLGEQSEVFFAFAMTLDAAALAFVVIGTARVLGFRRRWRVASVGLSAVLVFAAPGSFDLVAIALAVWALVLWIDDFAHPGRGWLSGILLGLAVLVSPVALLVLAAVLIHGLRTRGAKLRQLTALTCCAIGTAAAGAALDPSFPGTMQYWLSYGVGPGSLWWLANIGGVAASQGLEVGLALGIVVLILVVLGACAARRPDIWKFETVLSVTLVSSFVALPALPPQASLWLIPVAALTAPQWAVQLPWMFCEVFFAVCLSLYRLETADPGKGVATWILVVFVLARLASIVALLIYKPVDDGFTTPRGWLTSTRHVRLRADPPAKSASADALATPDEVFGDLWGNGDADDSGSSEQR